MQCPDCAHVRHDLIVVAAVLAVTLFVMWYAKSVLKIPLLPSFRKTWELNEKVGLSVTNVLFGGLKVLAKVPQLQKYALFLVNAKFVVTVSVLLALLLMELIAYLTLSATILTSILDFIANKVIYAKLKELREAIPALMLLFVVLIGFQAVTRAIPGFGGLFNGILRMFFRVSTSLLGVGLGPIIGKYAFLIVGALYLYTVLHWKMRYFSESLERLYEVGFGGIWCCLKAALTPQNIVHLRLPNW